MNLSRFVSMIAWESVGLCMNLSRFVSMIAWESIGLVLPGRFTNALVFMDANRLHKNKIARAYSFT